MIGVQSIKKERLKAAKRGVEFRYVTEITNDNLAYCKEMIKFADLRHLNEVKGNFEISDSREYVATATLQEQKPISQLIYSNVNEIVNQQQFVFDTLWNKAIPSEARIKEIEEGVRLETIDIIRSPKEALNKELELLKSAKHEILIIFSSLNTFYIQESQLRITKILKDSARCGVSIRILTPVDKHIAQIMAELKEEIKGNNNNNNSSKNNHNNNNTKNNNITTRDDIPCNPIQIQDITQTTGIKSKTIVVDKQESLTMEIKDTNSTQSLNQAIGLSTYSNSKSTTLSYLSIFEALWNESKLKTKLEDAYNRLESYNKAQREFISVAAHELRTPIMPILGFAEMLLQEETEEEKKKSLSAIIRNSQRLSRLASDILDTAKIEAGTLKLQTKEVVNLNELLSEIVNDSRKRNNEKQQREQYDITGGVGGVVFSSKQNNTNRHSDDDHNNNAKTNIVLKTFIQKRDQGNEDEEEEEDILVNVDKERLTQVMFNLLDNALKFSSEGGGNGGEGEDIVVTLEKKKEDNTKKSNDMRREVEEEEDKVEEEEEVIVISVKDRGSGINQEILPRIFSKFTTKSDRGTGLGLYICKYLVEAHGGRIWAENNTDGKGATITFTLPLKQ
jgi:signal transduction histidine kinase